MNNSVANQMDAYEKANNGLQSMEKAILAQDVSFTSLEPVLGKFFIPSITPSLDTTKSTKKNVAGRTQSNYIELCIPPHMLLMFMNPKIIPLKNIKHNPEKCIEGAKAQDHTIKDCNYILGFSTNKFRIPKGTEFLVEFLGGEMKAELMAIVGIFSISAAKSKTEPSASTSGRRK